MSYGISPIAVSFQDVQLVFESGDESIIATLKANFDYRFEELDWDDDADLDLETAIRHLITGSDQDLDYGHLYAYGLELICLHFGELQSNEHWSAMHYEWGEKVDTALQSLGLDESVFGVLDHLFDRGAPIPMPVPDDVPLIGFLMQSEISPALDGLNDLSLQNIDAEVQESVKEIKLWLQTCVDRNCDLITFYY